MKQETFRGIILIFMVLLSIGIIFAYKEIKYYNNFLKETGRNPCSFCQEINEDVLCQKVDTSLEINNPCQQCKKLGFGVLGYVE